MASATVLMCSASSSGISTSNSSSIAITSSTMSRLSAPKSSMKEDSGLISSSPTPSCSAMMDFTFCSIPVVDISFTLLRVQSHETSLRSTKSHVHPAVDPQHLAGDVGSSGGGQEDHRLRH